MWFRISATFIETMTTYGSRDVTDEHQRPLRADAERNRRRILEAAGRLFAERGLDVPLDDIAACAGVGIGTVYRRFADKDALIDALFEEKLHGIEQLALDAVRIGDPWDAFEHFMRGVCAMHAADRGLKEAMLTDDSGRDRARRARDTIAPLGEMLLRRAQDAGVVRADLVTSDVPLMHFAVGFIADKTREAAPDAWKRILTLFLDGLKVRREDVTPLTGTPVRFEDLPATVSRRVARPQT
jgi:AcrR family transcriptional regulator